MKIHISVLSVLVLSFHVSNLSSAQASVQQSRYSTNELKTFLAPATQSLGCAEFKDDFWDIVEYFPLNSLSFAPAHDLQQSLSELLQTQRFANFTGPEKDRAASKLSELYQFVVQATLKMKTSQETLELLSALELGDRTTPEKSAFQIDFNARLRDLDNSIAPGQLECPQSQPKLQAELNSPSFPANSMLGTWQRTQAPAVFGALKALATAYQSCEAGNLAPINNMVPDVNGIVITGTHPNGVGHTRKISDLAALLQTDYYFTHYKKPSSNCFDVRSNPLIYNYGGKPNTNANAGAAMDFFTHAGSGTTATLGIDCSGYVFSSLAAAGLKVKKEGRLKTTSVYGINAQMYMNPKANGLTCLDPVTFNGVETLHPGDIMASSGHVAMIASVGNDPFGVAGFTKEADCTKANMSTSRLNFAILQISAAKNGIGINHITATEFLVEEFKFADGLLQYAVDACLAHVRHSAVAAHATTVGLVRHLDSVDCQDQAAPLAHENCIDSCPATSGDLQDSL